MRINTLLEIAQRIANEQDRPVLIVDGTVNDTSILPADLRASMTGEPAIIETDTVDELYEIAGRIKDIICPPGTPYQFVDLPEGHDITLRIVHQHGAMETFDYNLLVGSSSMRKATAKVVVAELLRPIVTITRDADAADCGVDWCSFSNFEARTEGEGLLVTGYRHQQSGQGHLGPVIIPGPIEDYIAAVIGPCDLSSYRCTLEPLAGTTIAVQNDAKIVPTHMMASFIHDGVRVTKDGVIDETFGDVAKAA